MPVDEDRQGGGKMEYNDRMKTKPLTFLLVLTFLFLFSGASVVFGGVFDKKDESVVMICKGNLGSFSIK